MLNYGAWLHLSPLFFDILGVVLFALGAVAVFIYLVRYD